MKTIIDYKKFGKSFQQIQIEETEKYRNILLDSGMEEISKADLIDMLAELGYKIDNSCILNYYNNYNEHNYLAKSMSYTDIKTKQSFAHFEQSFTNTENLEKLQKIRQHYFVYEKNRIWDL